ncbi:MAG: type II toxin-antitoxin system VapC family toxin [Anaerolineales bacterium]|nr:type II toxin-antitoxin system VapC family toxin [Anaerolineales bacterium]
MTYLLDTNFCIELLNQRESPAARKLASVSPQDVCLCAVVKAELYHGAYKSGREANLNLVRSFFALFESLPFDDRSAEIYGRLRTDLEKRGNPIGPNDLLIASIALANNRTLITHNTDEFKRIANLPIEDWQT